MPAWSKRTTAWSWVKSGISEFMSRYWPGQPWYETHIPGTPIRLRPQWVLLPGQELIAVIDEDDSQ